MAREWVAGKWVVQPVQRKCKRCETTLAPHQGLGAPRKYCDGCRPTHYWRISDWQRQNAQRVREYRRTRFGERPIYEYDCRECGRRSIGYTDDRCPTCRNREKRHIKTGVPSLDTPRSCKGCGITFVPIERNQQRYCASDCPERPSSKRPSIPKHLRRKVLRRDEWVCYLCGEDIPQDVPWHDPLGATVDHVVPWIKGGSGSLDNLRAAHWSCNRRKAASLLEVA